MCPLSDVNFLAILFHKHLQKLKPSSLKKNGNKAIHLSSRNVTTQYIKIHISKS